MKAAHCSPWLVQGVACLHFAVLLSIPTSASSSAVLILAQHKGFLSGGHALEDPTKETIEKTTVLKEDPKEESEGAFPIEIPIGDIKAPITKWSAKMKMPKSFALLIAFAWIMLLGAAPILIHVLDHRPVTKTGTTISCLMWVALFGGLYVFTNVVFFKSPHFDSVRSLTIIECIYFMAQIITTVGYGDIVPAYSRGQVFVSIYAILAFVVIAEMMTEMIKIVSTRISEVRADLSTESAETYVTPRPKKPSVAKFLTSTAVFAVIATMFVLFFHFFPGEEKDWLQAVYMAVITMSMVGFGVVTPVTEEGMVFGAFFMLFGAMSLTRMVVEFSEFMMHLQVWESFEAAKLQGKLEGISRDDNLSEVEFLCVTLLENKIITRSQLNGIRQGFAALQPRKGAVCIHHLCASARTNSNPTSPQPPSALPGVDDTISESASEDERPELERPQSATRMPSV